MREICKPYKKNMKTWNHIKGKDRTDYGRLIVNIEIGEKRIINDSDDVVKTIPLCEDIYIDILKGIMYEKNLYQTYLTLGCTPNMVISYNGRIIVHNDKINDYIQIVTDILEEYDLGKLCDCLKSFILNENAKNKYENDLKKLTDSINKKCKKYIFSSAFIGLVLKEYIIEDMRNIQEEYEYLKNLKVEKVYVGTQVSNIEAINFYFKNGFKIHKISSIYHIWKK